MSSLLSEIFNDELLINKIQRKLPYFFKLVELEFSKAGKVGMEVGSAREKILIALLIYKFGEEKVSTDVAVNQSEVDVILDKTPISIKTVSGKSLTGIKLIWTVDREKLNQFVKNYRPSCDMLVVHVNWGGEGALYYVPLEVQERVFQCLGASRYIKLPKQGTNPRGAELSREATRIILGDEEVKKIVITWQQQEIDFKPYQRWVEMWREE